MENLSPFILNCFCGSDESAGNPAAVYIDSVLNDNQKQHIATKLNLPVTVFITGSDSKSPGIEYYYPNKKMPLCLHGTLAAAYVFFKKYDRKDGVFLTANGKELKFQKNLNDYFSVEVFPDHISKPHIPLSLVSDFFNVDVKDLSNTLPLTVASVGSPKLLIPVPANILLELKPNYSEIEKWSIKNKVNGLYVYSNDLLESNMFLARGFNPMGGHNEDAATGVAAGALSSVLKRSLIVEQGHALGKPCRIMVDYKDQNSIWVGGQVR